MRRLFKKENLPSIILSILLSAAFVAVSASAATTISTNISTGNITASAITASGITLASGQFQASSTALFGGNNTFGDASTDVNLFTGTLQASTTALFSGVSTFYGNVLVNGFATTTASNGDLGLQGQLRASSTSLFTGVSTFYGNVLVNGFATTTATSGDFKTAGQINASSTVLSTGLISFGDVSLFGKATTTYSTGDFKTQGQIQASSTVLSTGLISFGDISAFGKATTTYSTGDFKTQGQIQASSTVLLGSSVTTYGNLTVDKAATTTVTFNQAGINFDSNTLVVDPNANRIGVGSSSPLYALDVTGTTTSSGGMQIGHQGSGVSALRFGTCTYNPGAAITASTTVSTNCTGAIGVVTSDRVFVMPSNLSYQLIVTSASSTAADTIQVSVYNTGYGGSGTTTSLVLSPSSTWSWIAIR